MLLPTFHLPTANYCDMSYSNKTSDALLIFHNNYLFLDKKKNERTEYMICDTYQRAEYHKNEENGCESWTFHDSDEDKRKLKNQVLLQPKYTKYLTTIKGVEEFNPQ